ncbi:hypothetical protein DNTS_016514 [Danionella cerebrum]|uniref:RUN domain-containing protein n=1 Tax=Danionella cerebrum TaxID=2873325 RepID=A0A553MR52_9TELE|nr:hypothetical protein DNTS_016514 [Danionella translucida]TRY55667.1 hypothetical protein DNTS_016514 [Danionella translucida]
MRGSRIEATVKGLIENPNGAMLATQTPESIPEAKDVKQWIKDRIAQTLKSLQKRFITADTAVTSEDSDVNLLCCALEAVFIHGIKSKFVRSDGKRKGGMRGGLPQPVFWNLLKSVTHRDVVHELNRLSFINSDVGRCRAWVRLALNDGLLECYLTSMLREGSNLTSFYQPGALLLDPEEREVLLTLLQGLTSLTFQLSYKSAVLNEWTNTPLVLAGLCPLTSADEIHLGTKRKESWDTVSQSSGGSGSLDWALQKETRKEQTEIEGCDRSTPLTSSNMSLETSGSSHLSSSLSSDSLLQGQEKENWNCEAEINHNQPLRTNITGEALMKGDFDAFLPVQDNLIDANVVDNLYIPSEDTYQPYALIIKNSITATDGFSEMDGRTEETQTETKRLKSINTGAESPVREQSEEHRDSTFDSPSVYDLFEDDEKKHKDPVSETDAELVETASRRRAISWKTSTDSMFSSCKSTSWISEEDFCKPEDRSMSEEYAVIEVTQLNDQEMPLSETDGPQSPPSVVHRRHNDLPNPFRGLLKLGHLERRSAVGMWWDYYCELSPFELRLYLNAEERVCSQNLSLLRCEDVHLSSDSEGRFHLSFQTKRVFLRAPSKGEAEDWVDRISEAVTKLRPMMREEQWEILETTPSSPECILPEIPHFDWTRQMPPEPEAVKEAVVYQSLDEKGWRSVVLSLSLEALTGFQIQGDSKTPLFSHPIGSIRDVVPHTSLGSAAFFKVLTIRDALILRAEGVEEAHGWRSLIRGALHSYLDSEEDTPSPAGHQGSVHKLVQHRYRLCEFSAQYYCESCHQGGMSIIPSRMLHNWDLSTRQVSIHALRLLEEIEHEPLLNLSMLNPALLSHAELMKKVQSLRKRLRFLGDYILLCRSRVSKKIQPRLQQRSYLLENSDLYSVLDLQQSVIEFGSKHVHSCELCTQRGFICQICNQHNIIFPFQFGSTSRSPGVNVSTRLKHFFLVHEQEITGVTSASQSSIPPVRQSVHGVLDVTEDRSTWTKTRKGASAQMKLEC